MANVTDAATKLVIGVALACAVLFIYNRGTKVDYAVEDRAKRVSPAETSTENKFTGDRTGHEAGYTWAEAEGIDDEDDCDAAADHPKPSSFAEGCKAFVNGEADADTHDADTHDEEEDDSDVDDRS